MALSPFKLPFLAAYVVVGAIVGVLVIHPLNLVVVWWELARFSETAPNLLEFLTARLWLVLLPRHLDVAVAYTGLGAVVGLAFGMSTTSTRKGFKYSPHVHMKGDEIAKRRGGLRRSKQRLCCCKQIRSLSAQGRA